MTLAPVILVWWCLTPVSNVQRQCDSFIADSFASFNRINGVCVCEEKGWAKWNAYTFQRRCKFYCLQASSTCLFDSFYQSFVRYSYEMLETFALLYWWFRIYVIAYIFTSSLSIDSCASCVHNGLLYRSRYGMYGLSLRLLFNGEYIWETIALSVNFFLSFPLLSSPFANH